MIGRTNAIAGGGGLKSVKGSFTSSKTETQKSFTVSGLDFEPKAVAVYSSSYTEVGNATSANTILIGSFADLERKKGFYIYKRSGGTIPQHNGSANLTVSGSDGTYTFTASSIYFSNISSNNGYYASFTYYIYG